MRHNSTLQQLDILKRPSIERFASGLASDLIRVDALVNNASVALNGFDATVARDTLGTNFYGTRDLTDLVSPVLVDCANIVMVSSGLGELSCLGQKLRKIFSAPTLNREGLSDVMGAFVAAVVTSKPAGLGRPTTSPRWA